MMMRTLRLALGVWLALLAVLLFGSPDLRAENRTYDGWGNNLANPAWGSAGTTLLRKAAVGYADGLSTPRGASGAPLPNPRAVSNMVVKQVEMAPNTHLMTDWVFQWGQFIDHDLDLTDLAAPSEPFHIAIPAGDPQFDPTHTGTAIMSFTRSKYATPAPGEPRQQINELTSYIDGSQVYGSTAARALALRSMTEGRLKTSAGDLLPFNEDLLPNGTGGPVPDFMAKQFYLAGDVRANEQVGLTAVHTLFVREHNRLAGELAPAYAGIADAAARDEAIYQRARKLVGAEIQAITFNEFLPALLGDYAPDVFGFYDPNVNAAVSTEFSTALFRVGHTMLSPQLMRMTNEDEEAPGGHMSLRDSFFKMANMSGPNELEYLLKGLASDQQQEVDMHVVDDVRDFLFGEPIPGGFDLASLNIQRGRDHGLPGYNDVREAFGLPRRDTFADITSDPEIQARLAALYASPDAIDPWVGALSEDHLAATTPDGVGAAVGELIAVGLVDQFTRARDGDRFWFLNDAELSDADVDWLLSRRLSDVIRGNTSITNLQDGVFFMPHPAPEPSTGILVAIVVAVRAARRRG